ncbi:MAG: type I pullulanase [Chthoniobacterales bacterium]
MHVPLQPVAPGVAKPLVKKRRGCGCGSSLLLFLIIAAAGFVYLMYRFQESPHQTAGRLTTFARGLLQHRAEPATEQAPEQTPAPTIRPDPIAWMKQHKERWPAEVILREPFEFPAVSNGNVVGSLRVPARASVKVIDISQSEIEADYMGGRRKVPIAATDLRVRAEAALASSEREQPAGPGPSVTNEIANTQEVDSSREADRDQIKSGLGALYTGAATTFRLFAPASKNVAVVLYNQSTGEEGRSVYSLKQQPNNLWETSVRGDLRGKFYTFLLDQKNSKAAREILDPYAVNSVANSSRGRITPLNAPLTHGPSLASPTDAIIYEMHVRDFTIAPSSGVKQAGLYPGWTESGARLPDDEQIKTGIDHLRELGITHVELMPVQDFDNDESSRSYNWGYITSAFFSPEGMFATNPDDDTRVRELKALIRALHSGGIAVIMDVVYNHTSGNSSLLAISPDYYYRHSPNGSLANGSGCGNEFKSESPMGRRLIIDSLKFWAKEYGVDGFRFDLMALIDQETIRQADRELKKINPGIILFGEPWTGGTTPLHEKTDKQALRQVPAGVFNDDFRNALKGSPDHDDPGWIQNGSKRDALKSAMVINDWCPSPGQSINYMTCHDNLVLWDKLVHSMPKADDGLKLETMKLGYLALLTSQGVPFMHGGEEFARTKGGNNNSFEAPDSVNQVDWNLKRQHLDLFTYVRDLIGLRKSHPMFRLRTRADVRSRVQFINASDSSVLMFTVSGEGVPGEGWKRACVIMNSADEKTAAVSLPGGEWQVAMTEQGSATSPRLISGKAEVRYKSGLVLFQQ